MQKWTFNPQNSAVLISCRYLSVSQVKSRARLNPVTPLLYCLGTYWPGACWPILRGWNGDVLMITPVSPILAVCLGIDSPLGWKVAPAGEHPGQSMSRDTARVNWATTSDHCRGVAIWVLREEAFFLVYKEPLHTMWTGGSYLSASAAYKDIRPSKTAFISLWVVTVLGVRWPLTGHPSDTLHIRYIQFIIVAKLQLQSSNERILWLEVTTTWGAI